MLNSSRQLPGFFQNNYETYLSDDKLAGCEYTVSALKIGYELRKYLKSNESSLKCYIGELLALVQIMYLHVTPVENSKILRRIFMKLAEAGFPSFWVSEFFMKLIYKRIQDRPAINYIPSAKLAEEEVPWAAPHVWDGKLENVFVLWAVSISFGALVLIFENLRHCFKRRVVSRVIKLPRLHVSSSREK